MKSYTLLLTPFNSHQHWCSTSGHVTTEMGDHLWVYRRCMPWWQSQVKLKIPIRYAVFLHFQHQRQLQLLQQHPHNYNKYYYNFPLFFNPSTFPSYSRLIRSPTVFILFQLCKTKFRSSTPVRLFHHIYSSTLYKQWDTKLQMTTYL